jgi:hypothetical protein
MLINQLTVLHEQSDPSGYGVLPIPTNRPTDQPINQPTDQQINRSTEQPNNRIPAQKQMTSK